MVEQTAAWFREARRIGAEQMGVAEGSLVELTEAFAAYLERAGVGRFPPKTLANWCRGDSEPHRFGVILGIARVTGLSLDRLAGIYGPPEVGMAGAQYLERYEEIEQMAAQVLEAVRSARRSGPAAPARQRTTRRGSSRAST